MEDEVKSKDNNINDVLRPPAIRKEKEKWKKLYKLCTNGFNVSIFIDELPKKIHELTKWSSCNPGDSTHIFWEPFCSSNKGIEINVSWK